MASVVRVILYQDDHLVALDKPSGLAVHRGWDRSSDVAMTRVRDLLGRKVWPVHRLDRSASGVLLLALDRSTARDLGRMFARGEVWKRYLALVRGRLAEDGVIDHPLRRDRRGPAPAGSVAARLESVTRYRSVTVYTRDDLARSYTLVEALPETGRLHQIRRHFKHLSHPLIGDVRYGKGEHNRLFRERFGLQRLFLHASEVRFVHLHSGEVQVITAPLPDELARVLSALASSVEAPPQTDESQQSTAYSPP